MGKDELTAEAVDDTIGCILKYKQDLENIQKLEIPRILEQLKHELPHQHVQ